MPRRGQVENFRHVTVPVIPFVGTAQWKEFKQHDLKRMVPPVSSYFGDYYTYAYDKAFALYEKDHLCFAFDIMERRANVTVNLPFILHGKQYSINRTTTAADLEAMFDCAGMSPEAKQAPDDNYFYLQPRQKGSVCRLARNVRGGSYVIPDAGMTCDFNYDGRLGSVCLYSHSITAQYGLLPVMYSK